MRLTVQNASGAEMPPFALCRLKSTLGHTGLQSELPYFEAVKPDGIGGIYCVNGPTPLPDGRRRSMLMWEEAGAVAIDPADTVAYGDMIGPIVDQWYASLKGGGYFVMRAKAANNVVAVQYQRETLRRFARLTSTIAVAATMEGSEPTGTAILRKENATTGHYAATSTTITVRNRYEQLDYPTGIIVEVLSVFGKWRIVGADCEG
jgi:hypothetical protein